MSDLDILNELTRPSIPQAEEYLFQAGWRPIGGGHFSDVFGNPNKPYVLKLFSRSDRGYKWFLNYVETHSSPFLPKFIGKPIPVTDYYAAVRMPRYDRLGAYEGQVIDTLTKTISTGNTARLSPQFRAAYVDSGLLAVLDDIFKKCRSAGLQTDYHAGNFMLDQDGKIVITDPVKDESKLAKKGESPTYLQTRMKPGRHGPEAAWPTA